MTYCSTSITHAMMINKSVVCAIIAVYNASFFLARSSFFLYVTERRKVVKMHQIIPQWLTLKVRYQRDKWLRFRLLSLFVDFSRDFLCVLFIQNMRDNRAAQRVSTTVCGIKNAMAVCFDTLLHAISKSLEMKASKGTRAEGCCC